MKYNFDTIIDRRSTNSIKWTKYPENVIPLWVADMDFLTPQPILDALRTTLERGVLGYEIPSRSLFETVVARMEGLYGWKIDPGMVVATPGIVSGFNAAARTVCVPGDGILMQPPVYFPFLVMHENLGLARQFAPLVKVTDGNILRYETDFDAFEAAMGANDAPTRMFLFCNPHNPIGTVFTKEQLSCLAEICLRHGVVICSDEIHSELLLGGTQHIPLATLSPEIADRTITLLAPSKTFNTAGLFCGFAIIPNSELRERYQKAVGGMTLHVNSLGQIAAQTAFSGACDDWLKEVLVYLTANRDFLANYMQENMPEIHLTIPDATYMSWLDCNPLLGSGRISGSPFEFFLNEAKVALNDGYEFGPGGKGFVRLNFACPRSMLEGALDRIRDSLF
ncbi:MAG: PatB family C-S lyase [Anaerolineales bacterium]|nr:PatB family C-S lyase [Anaerolineales bacterium]